MAAATALPTPTVQWQVSTDSGNTFSSIRGATSPTLTFNTTAAQNGNEYRAVFTNSSGTATTAWATLTVTAPPTTLSAVYGNGAFGGNATFTATLTANGSPVPGKSIAFTLNEGGASTSVGTATTNASGIATLTGCTARRLRHRHVHRHRRCKFHGGHGRPEVERQRRFDRQPAINVALTLAPIPNQSVLLLPA